MGLLLFEQLNPTGTNLCFIAATFYLPLKGSSAFFAFCHFYDRRVKNLSSPFLFFEGEENSFVSMATKEKSPPAALSANPRRGGGFSAIPEWGLEEETQKSCWVAGETDNAVFFWHE